MEVSLDDHGEPAPATEKLHGVITSMLTPFTQGGALDEETLAGENLYEHQLRCG